MLISQSLAGKKATRSHGKGIRLILRRSRRQNWGPEAEVRGGRFWPRLKGAWTIGSLLAPQAGVFWVFVPVIIQSDFQKTAIVGGCLPREVEPGGSRKALPKSEGLQSTRSSPPTLPHPLGLDEAAATGAGERGVSPPYWEQKVMFQQLCKRHAMRQDFS